jgi:hypothetical protein
VDVEVARALQLALALIASVTLPCAIAAMICADEAIAAIRAAVRRRRERWSEHRTLGRLERSFAQARHPFPNVAAIFAFTVPEQSTGSERPAPEGDEVPTQPAAGGWHAIPAALRSRASELLRVLPVPRSLAAARPGTASEQAEEASWPPFEQVARDLRRLRADRLAIGQRNEVWHSAVEQVYDARLREACRALGIAEHLADLVGMDRDIERLRVEGELIAAGVKLQ